MKKILEKFMDERGYIRDLDKLAVELIKVYDAKIIVETIKEAKENNKTIIAELKKENHKLSEYKKVDNCSYPETNYSSIPRISKKKVIKTEKKKIDISFYTNFINDNKDNELYLEILPSTNTKENIKIIDRILSHYLKEKALLEYIIASDGNEQSCIEELITIDNIFNGIKKYKESLLLSKDKKESQDNIVYYCDENNIPYIYKDIEAEEGAYDSINELIDSLKDNTFKNLKSFTYNEKTRGLFEVRNLYSNSNDRILFTFSGNHKICIIGAIVHKKESNKLYKTRLQLRYQNYRNNMTSIINEEEDIYVKKLLKGDKNVRNNK